MVGEKQMKIKITTDIPIQRDLRPPIGSIHDVIDQTERHNKLYYIVYKGKESVFTLENVKF